MLCTASALFTESSHVNVRVIILTARIMQTCIAKINMQSISFICYFSLYLHEPLTQQTTYIAQQPYKAPKNYLQKNVSTKGQILRATNIAQPFA
ncbi:hypothetical protein VIBNISFn118_760047 [Vibrio nigripulchritudo SFn118]|nr:hypothetical protein VIBNISFn118_760047 [Vibrio nigripulchritudo SFn118]